MSSTKKARGQGAAKATRRDIKTFVLGAGFGGIRMAALMAATGAASTTVGDHLRALATANLIERSDTAGSSCAWGPPGTWAHHQKQRDRTAHERQLQRDRRARVAVDREAADEFADAPIVHRLVPAGLALPLAKRGPASAWELAVW